MWKQTLSLVVAASLLASPAFAHGRRGGKHDGHGHSRHEREWRDGGRRDHGHQRRDHGYGRHDDRRRHDRHHWRHDDRRRHDRYWWGFGPWWGPRRHWRHDHHSRNDDAYLWLGLAVAGAGAIALLSSSQRELHQDAWWQATRAPVGSRVGWNNPDASGSVTVLSEGEAPSGEYCREFQHDVRIAGRSERAWGTACYQEDGSWRLTSR